MQKNFEKWHKKKTNINNSPERLFFHEREVWWCSIGANVGFEQDGKGEEFTRPVLIFKKFNNEIFWALPVSTRVKLGKFYQPIDLGGDFPRVVIVSQLRLVDAKRLVDKMGIISKNNYLDIQKAVIDLCKL